MMPACITDKLWNRKAKSNDKVSYQQIINQINELHDQVEYLLSIKYQA